MTDLRRNTFLSVPSNTFTLINSIDNPHLTFFYSLVIYYRFTLKDLQLDRFAMNNILI